MDKQKRAILIRAKLQSYSEKIQAGKPEALLSALNTALMLDQMNIDLKGIASLIEKEKRDKKYLTNWIKRQYEKERNRKYYQLHKEEIKRNVREKKLQNKLKEVI